jgi:hypothetical protein
MSHERFTVTSGSRHPSLNIPRAPWLTDAKRHGGPRNRARHRKAYLQESSRIHPHSRPNGTNIPARPRTGWEDVLAATHPPIERRLERLEAAWKSEPVAVTRATAAHRRLGRVPAAQEGRRRRHRGLGRTQPPRHRGTTPPGSRRQRRAAAGCDRQRLEVGRSWLLRRSRKRQVVSRGRIGQQQLPVRGARPDRRGLKTQIALKDSEYDPSRRPGSRDARLFVHGADPH